MGRVVNNFHSSLLVVHSSLKSGFQKRQKPSPCFDIFAWRDSVKQLKRNEDFSPQSVGFFLQSMGFPFDIQGPGSSRNVLLHFLHNKAIEDGNQTCSPPFL